MNNACPYCGNNPVPHRVYWYNETLNILFTPIRQRLLYNPLTRFFKTQGYDAALAKFFLGLAESLKIIRRQNNLKLCQVRRAQVLWEQADKRGIAMNELLLFGRPFDSYVAKKSENPPPLKLWRTGQRIRESEVAPGQHQEVIFSGLPRPAGYTNHRLDIMDDKWLFKKIMLANGLPVPKGTSCSSLAQAQKIFDEIHGLTIVKPRAGSRGRHSATFVATPSDLKQAFKVAKQLCYWVMVEQQLFGPVYRATLINFELCGVLRGDPPQVIGDGKQTISELIKQKNSLPHPGVKDIVVDDSMKVFLSRQNLELSSIPNLNQQVNLSEKIGVNYGGSSSEDFDICHPDNKELFVKAAKALGDPILGFDFIIADISKSWKQQACGFIEVNSLPFINLHHDPLLGQPRNVAAKIWDMLGW